VVVWGGKRVIVGSRCQELKKQKKEKHLPRYEK